jgi:hypothetical protein
MTDIIGRLPLAETAPQIEVFAWYLLEMKSLQVIILLESG